MSIAHGIRRSLSRRFALPLYLSRSHFTRLFLTASVRDVAIRVGLADPLTKLAARYKSDKGVTVFPFHGYTTHYASLFAPLRDKPINILEIGLAREQDRATLGITCPSLSIWVDTSATRRSTASTSMTFQA